MNIATPNDLLKNAVIADSEYAKHFAKIIDELKSLADEMPVKTNMLSPENMMNLLYRMLAFGVFIDSLKEEKRAVSMILGDSVWEALLMVTVIATSGYFKPPPELDFTEAGRRAFDALNNRLQKETGKKLEIVVEKKEA